LHIGAMCVQELLSATPALNCHCATLSPIEHSSSHHE